MRLTVTVCYGSRMDAIELIRRTGLSTAEIADAVGCTTHAIRLYERGKRFPNEDNYRRLIELAKSRGVTLTAESFVSKAA